MRPLDAIRSLKLKLGIVIVATVVGTVGVLVVGRRAGLALEWRLVAAVAMGVLVAQLLARGMTSPLREMAAASRAMARGDYGRRVHATSRDEVGELARSFNTMAAELATVDRQRRDLVANVSHELRTPIGALQVLLENLIDGVAEPDEQTLRTAHAQTERLGRLVEQLLDLSRLDSGAVPLRPSAFAAAPLLEQVAEEGRLHAAQPVDVRWEAEPADLRLTGDSDRLHQVLANLVDNAVRHSPSGGRVTIRARRLAHAGHSHGGHAELSVSDQGPGIPAADLERVFERFFRTDRSRTAADGGTGLGLAIARSIVDAHGGSIRATNEPIGSRFVVELPIR
ncbi:MAG: HAMP domain-containing protein [Solirubrobacteraceae bacterium]|nr:HAMP domain-containing protein [Solirubrobacteraceae bacterium]